MYKVVHALFRSQVLKVHAPAAGLLQDRGGHCHVRKIMSGKSRLESHVVMPDGEPENADRGLTANA
jgi:hypothetical protein